MDPILLHVGAGMKAQSESLDLLANNVANANTTAYKADREFYRLFQTALAEADPRTGEAGVMPVVEGSVIDFRQGPLTRTDAPLDAAIEGPGFFVVEGEASPLYTRNGRFDRDPQGTLRTFDGRAVLDAEGEPIELPPNGEVEIGRDGLITVNGLAVARLAVVEFPQPGSLSKAGETYFQAAGGVEPRPAAASAVLQGKLEGSNVNVPQAAVQLIAATRNFSMMRRAASLVGEEMNRQAVDVLGRTS